MEPTRALFRAGQGGVWEEKYLLHICVVYISDYGVLSCVMVILICGIVLVFFCCGVMKRGWTRTRQGPLLEPTCDAPTLSDPDWATFESRLPPPPTAANRRGGVGGSFCSSLDIQTWPGACLADPPPGS